VGGATGGLVAGALAAPAPGAQGGRVAWQVCQAVEFAWKCRVGWRDLADLVAWLEAAGNTATRPLRRQV
jgi:hypothetical protein